MPATLSPVDAPECRRPSPGLAPGTELLGEYRDSGRTEAPSIIRRNDGRMLEVSPLLFQLAASLDPAQDLQWVARRLGGRLRRSISAGSVAYLIDNKLRPLGVLADSPAAATEQPSTPDLLGLTLHAGVVPAPAVRAFTTILRPLFFPPVVVLALLALIAGDVWIWRSHQFGAGLRDVFTEPALMLLVIVLTVVAGAFHELGHATASRYAGAEPGEIGAGIYLLWPVFYNDLDDSYRLNRTDRLRCDLGGVYFNVLFILAVFGAYALTGYTPLLVVAAAQHLMILQQFLPFVRLDGYYVVSDLAGVPDLFRRVRPVLSSLVPGRDDDPAVSDLKPGARAIVTTWVLVTVPLLAASLAYLGYRLPSLATGMARSAAAHAGELGAALGDGRLAVAAMDGLSLCALAVPVIGLTVTLVRAVRRSSDSGLTRRISKAVLTFGAPR
jgi:putative peptide zinc metalloprotease protein